MGCLLVLVPIDHLTSLEGLPFLRGMDHYIMCTSHTTCHYLFGIQNYPYPLSSSLHLHLHRIHRLSTSGILPTPLTTSPHQRSPLISARPDRHGDGGRQNLPLSSHTPTPFLSLMGKKFLLVTDNVWEKEKTWWHKIYDELPKGNGSSILITTRIKEVVKMMGVEES